jgi:hypothetical protein
MKQVLIIFASLLSLSSYSQSTVENFTTISGQPFFPRTYQDVNGTPYLFDDWEPSTITLMNGAVLRDIKTNFNAVTDELLYIDNAGKTMVANPTVVKEIEVNAGTTRKFITTAAKNAYYEILSSPGNATLLRFNKKVIIESKPYNSATVQKNFIRRESLMLSYEGSVTEVKSSYDLFDLLKPAEPLKEFAKNERLKNRSVDSWIRIVDYYNSSETRLHK